MQRCDKRREKRLKELDKERFHGREEIVDVGELQDALVRDLWRGGQDRAGVGQATYDKDELEVVDERPFDGVAILFVFFFRGAALDECFADERVDRRCGGGSDMRGFGRERARPEYDTACNQRSNEVLNTGPSTYLCAKWSSDPTCSMSYTETARTTMSCRLRNYMGIN